MSGGDEKTVPSSSSGDGGVSSTGDSTKKKRKNPLGKFLKAITSGGGSSSSNNNKTSSPKAHIPISVAAAEQHRALAKGTVPATTAVPAAAAVASPGTGPATVTTTKAAATATAAVVGSASNHKFQKAAGLTIAKNATTTKTMSSKKNKKKKTSWLTRTATFRNMLDWAFTEVDADGSGHVDEKELYSGLLLIHLKLGTYAGPAACKPISRAKCHDVFVKMDTDHSGTLDREEFDTVMMVLFGNVMLRVMFQYACTLLIVPMIAQLVLSGIAYGIKSTYQFLSTLDEHSQVADVVEVQLEDVWAAITTKVDDWTPEQFHEWTSILSGYIHAVPASVWNTIPLTLLSTILSLMIIPWSLMKIDDFFQSLADKAKKDKEDLDLLEVE